MAALASGPSLNHALAMTTAPVSLQHAPTQRVALITGANVGIGRVTAIELARAGVQVVIAGRSLQRTQPVLDTIAALPGALPARVITVAPFGL